MRTHVEFRSDQFPSYGDASEGTNGSADFYGKRLAEYLQQKLPQHGVGTGKILAEDLGWCVPVDNGSPVKFIGCGHYQEYDNGFLCFIEPGKPFIRKLFCKIDIRPDLEIVAKALDTVLREDAGITGIRWWDAEESSGK